MGRENCLNFSIKNDSLIPHIKIHSPPSLLPPEKAFPDQFRLFVIWILSVSSPQWMATGPQTDKGAER